jgi:SWI/SNF-related matrix-associated actin-dependent regulator of chromatin subfamily A3
MTAHTIQNPQSQLAQACCQIHSTRRWAITGTPIQNKLIDFASIVRFLRVHPYSDPKIFDEEIMRPWQNRHSTDAQGFLRLKALVRAITISRTKAVVQLPPRVDEVHHLKFSPAERERYDAAKSQSKVLLEDAIASQNQGSKTFNALWLLNTLRLICNHGLLAKSAVERDISQTPQASRDSWFQGQGFETFYGNVLGGNASCSNCGANLLDDILEGSVSTDIETQRHVIPPGQVICNGCHSQIGHNRINTSFSSNLESPDSAGSSAPTTPRIDDNVATIIDNMSTKIKALVADLCKHSDNEKRF